MWPSLPHLVSNSVGVCWQLHRGFFEVPIGRVWPDSNSLGVCWQLLRGFPRSPSVGCGLPYHISSLTLWESAGNCIGGFPRSPSVGCGLILTLWESAGNCIGGFRGPPRSGVAFPTTSGLCLEFDWQLLWDPNSTELNTNSTPTRSPSGSLRSNV